MRKLIFLLVTIQTFSALGTPSIGSKGPSISILRELFSMALGETVYHRLMPYKPYLLIDGNGVATKEQQFSWKEFRNAEKIIEPVQCGNHVVATTSYVFNYVRDGINNSIKINADLIAMEEEELFNLVDLRSRSNSATTPEFPHELSSFALEQIKTRGVYQDKVRTIICYPRMGYQKSVPLTLLTGSLVLLAGTCYQHYYRDSEPGFRELFPS